MTSEEWRGEAIEAAEERRGDAIEAAAQCRDDQAERVPEPEADGERGYRVVWVDSGSGPGFEVLVPADDWPGGYSGSVEVPWGPVRGRAAPGTRAEEGT